MEAQRQLNGRHAPQRETCSRQRTARAEKDGGAVMGLLHERGRVGPDAHQGFGTIEGVSHVRRGCSGAGLQPGLALAHSVGRQSAEEYLQPNARWTPAHQMLHMEGALHFFVTGFDGLARVVMSEPVLATHFLRANLRREVGQ
jgi:hypothetical protein